MSPAHVDEDAEATPLESIGEACARALAIALAIGLLEGAYLGRGEVGSPRALGLATAGLWSPIALVLASLRGLYDRFVGGDGDRDRRVGLVLGYGLLATSSFLIVLTRHGVSAPLVIAPVEAFAALLFAWATAHVRATTRSLRRAYMVIGLVGMVALQAFATRWIDGNRAFASLLVEGSCVPRVILRTVLRRFV